MSDQYGYPHIRLSRLRDMRKQAKSLEPFNFYDIWIDLVRQEIDRLIIEDLQTKIRNAKNYRNIEGYPCPLCEYENGLFIRSCSMHQKIDELTEELARSEAIIRMYEENDE